jgi:hypothetical protein
MGILTGGENHTSLARQKDRRTGRSPWAAVLLGGTVAGRLVMMLLLLRPRGPTPGRIVRSSATTPF